LLSGDDIERLGCLLGCLLEHRGYRGDVVVGVLEPTDARTPLVVEREVVRQHGTEPGEIAGVERAEYIEQPGRDGPRRVAAGEAFEQLRAGGPAIVGVEDDERHE